MMCGEFPPTAGRMLLGGYDIETDRKKAQENIGYCPQFDALLDYLSVPVPRHMSREPGCPQTRRLADARDSILQYLDSDLAVG